MTKPMSGAEIAEELNITRQDVSQILKRAMEKIFYQVKNNDRSVSDFDVMSEMALMLNVEQSQEEFCKFFRLDCFII